MPKIVQEELVPVFAEAQKLGVKTVLDVATPGRANYLPRLEKLLRHVDVFLPNNHEAELISGEKDPLRQADVVRRPGGKTAGITIGGDRAVPAPDRRQLRAGGYGAAS